MLDGWEVATCHSPGITPLPKCYYLLPFALSVPVLYLTVVDLGPSRDPPPPSLGPHTRALLGQQQLIFRLRISRFWAFFVFLSNCPRNAAVRSVPVERLGTGSRRLIPARACPCALRLIDLEGVG